MFNQNAGVNALIFHILEHGIYFLTKFFFAEIGIAVDFKALKRELDALLGELDHKDLNSIPPFDKLNPTSENIAMYIYKRLSGKLNGNGVKVYRVRVGENASSGASYFED